MVPLVAQGADAGVTIAVVGDVNLQLRRPALDVGGVDAQAGVGRVGAQGAVQDGGVGRVDAAFQRLQPVALLDVLGYVAVGVRHGGPLELRRRRRMLLRPHVSPDDAAQLHGGVGGGGHLGREVAVGGFVHHVGALAVDVEFPAVIHAAQAAFLVASQPQRRQPVGTQFFQQADASVGVAESDQLLAQELDADRLAVGLGQLPREQGGHPVAAHQLAHGSPGADLGQRNVISLRNHGGVTSCLRLGWHRISIRRLSFQHEWPALYKKRPEVGAGRVRRYKRRSLQWVDGAFTGSVARPA